jgi:hypothetical protein
VIFTIGIFAFAYGLLIPGYVANSPNLCAAIIVTLVYVVLLVLDYAIERRAGDVEV